MQQDLLADGLIVARHRVPSIMGRQADAGYVLARQESTLGSEKYLYLEGWPGRPVVVQRRWISHVSSSTHNGFTGPARRAGQARQADGRGLKFRTFPPSCAPLSPGSRITQTSRLLRNYVIALQPYAHEYPQNLSTFFAGCSERPSSKAAASEDRRRNVLTLPPRTARAVLTRGATLRI